MASKKISLTKPKYQQIAVDVAEKLQKANYMLEIKSMPVPP